MSVLKEFRDFAVKGNAIDLAVGVIIGGAFGKVIGSAVDDVIMPIVGLVTGGVDFTQKFITLDGNSYDNLAAAKTAGAAVITYGNLVQAIINFVIISLFIFIILRAAEKARKKEEVVVVAAPAGPTQEELLTQIRDLLKK